MIIIGLCLIGLAIVGMPLFAVLGGLAWVLFHLAEIDTSAIMIEFYRLASSPTLTTIPLFTFAGTVLAASQAPQRLVRCAQAPRFGSHSTSSASGELETGGRGIT